MAAFERTGADVRAHSAGDPGSATVKCLELIAACRLEPDDPIVSVGDIDAQLIGGLLAAGHRDVTVLHPAAEALEALRGALGAFEREVDLLETDVLDFQPRRRYALWHDRGLFECLPIPEDRQRYVEVLQQALRPEGHFVICAFGPEKSPEREGSVRAVRYSASGLAGELGRQFELTEHGLTLHPTADGGARQLLHCRFKRHAPHWPS